MEEVGRRIKDLRKLGVRNISEYSTANLPFSAFFLHRHSLLSHYSPYLEERVALTLVPRSYALRMIVKLEKVRDFRKM